MAIHDDDFASEFASRILHLRDGRIGPLGT
jgi:hypothetical protein